MPHSLPVWLVEGLTVYLPEAGVRGVLAQAASLATPGSRLFADITGRGMLESPWTRGVLDAMKRENAPWIFGTDEPEALCAELGWRATVTRPGDPDATFGRWPYPAFPRGAPGVPSNFFVMATRI